MSLLRRGIGARRPARRTLVTACLTLALATSVAGLATPGTARPPTTLPSATAAPDLARSSLTEARRSTAQLLRAIARGRTAATKRLATPGVRRALGASSWRLDHCYRNPGAWSYGTYAGPAPWACDVVTERAALALGLVESAGRWQAVDVTRLPRPTGPGLRLLWRRATDVVGPGARSGRWWVSSIDRGPGPHQVPPPVPVGLEVGNAWTGTVRRTPTPGRRLICSLEALAPVSAAGTGRFLVGTFSLPDYQCERQLLEVTTDGFRWDPVLPADEVVGPSPSADVRLGEEYVGFWGGVTVVTQYLGRVPQGDTGNRTWRLLARAEGTTLWSSRLTSRISLNLFASWNERAVASRWGLMTVRYDFQGLGQVPDLGDQPDALLRLVDPRTGRAGRTVGRVEDSSLRWLVGDVAIFWRGGDYVAGYDGYRLTGEFS